MIDTDVDGRTRRPVTPPEQEDRRTARQRVQIAAV